MIDRGPKFPWKRKVSRDAATSGEGASNPDQEVLRYVESGDRRTALRRLMQLHGASIYRYCLDALGDRELAEDVQQQVFLEAFRDISRFKQRSSVRTWLFAIARHRILDATKIRRRALARVSAVEFTELTHEPDPRPSPAESVDAERMRQVLQDCIDALTEPTRTALLLRFKQGFSLAQIGEICGEAPGVVASRITRALPRLRAAVVSRIEDGGAPGQRGTRRGCSALRAS